MKLAPGIAALATVVACSPDGGDYASREVPQYGAVETRLLDGELVNFQVQMKNPASGDDVIAYSDCVAAQYALIRGAGFVRRVTNDVTRRGGWWVGNGVYTLSDAHPGGVHTIDAEATTEACRAGNIPTV